MPPEPETALSDAPAAIAFCTPRKIAQHGRVQQLLIQVVFGRLIGLNRSRSGVETGGAPARLRRLAGRNERQSHHQGET